MCFHSSLNQCTQKMSFLSLPRIQEESSQCPLEFCNSCRRIKRFLYSFSGSFASKFEMTQILFVPRSCGLSFASRFTGCWLWFHDSLCTSLEILSLVLPVRFFFILDELQSPETAFTNPPLIVFYQWKWYCCLEYCVEGAQQYRTRQGVKALNP